MIARSASLSDYAIAPTLIHIPVSVCGGLLSAWAGYSIGRAVQ
jgi:hypothetical protein